MITGMDDYMDLVKTVLVAGIAELTTDNVVVYLMGLPDPDEDIRSGIARCHGVSCLITDQGGDSDPDDAESPCILSEIAVEIYLDPTKRNRRKTASLRTMAEIRESVMRLLHLNATLASGEHVYMEPRVKGYSLVADPDYVVSRIRLQRSIYLG